MYAPHDRFRDSQSSVSTCMRSRRAGNSNDAVLELEDAPYYVDP